MSLAPMVALWVAAIALGDGSQSPERTLSGTVEDSLGGAIPAAVVTVACNERTVTVSADDRGAFSVNGLPPAACRVLAERDLFTPATAQVDLTREDAASVRLVLHVAGLETERRLELLAVLAGRSG